MKDKKNAVKFSFKEGSFVSMCGCGLDNENMYFYYDRSIKNENKIKCELCYMVDMPILVKEIYDINIILHSYDMNENDKEKILSIMRYKNDLLKVSHETTDKLYLETLEYENILDELELKNKKQDEEIEYLKNNRKILITI